MPDDPRAPYETDIHSLHETSVKLNRAIARVVAERERVLGWWADVPFCRLLIFECATRSVKGGAKLGHWGGVKVHRLRERTRF